MSNKEQAVASLSTEKKSILRNLASLGWSANAMAFYRSFEDFLGAHWNTNVLHQEGLVAFTGGSDPAVYVPEGWREAVEAAA